MKQWYVYIITNKKNWTIYVWVTNDLERRIYEHKNKLIDWFSKKYWLDKLVYYEEFDDIKWAIEKEKYLKWLNRVKKLEIIEKDNYLRNDLSANRH